MKERDRYIEYKIVPQFWGWVIITLYSAVIIGFGMLVHHIVPERPREWNYGQLPDTPAESVYSTVKPPEGAKPERVIPRLPEARPLDTKLPPPDWAEKAKEEYLETGKEYMEKSKDYVEKGK
ncbi:MAG TPA: hypothetical protein VF790_14525 [Dissulfurispiraceae bacterium]